GVVQELKEFAVKGNVVDMAVGIIIGAAFGTIAKSLVDDVIMPPIGLILGGVDLSDLYITSRAGTPAGPADAPAPPRRGGPGPVPGGVDFSDLYITLRAGTPAGPYDTLAAAREAGAVTINYGVFLNNVISFLVVSAAVFILVRGINRLRREEQVAPASPTEKACPFCATTIPIAARRCPHCTSQLEAAA